MMQVAQNHLTNLASGAIQQYLSRNEFSTLRVLQPPLIEQKYITQFLDNKINKIDALTEKKQRLIELLKEQRTAIINQAVTKGLNPNVMMKDSGVEWLGEIPEHWEVMKLKRIINPLRRITYGIVQPGKLDLNGRYMVRGQDYSFGWANPDTIFRVSPEIETPYKRSRLSAGDVLLTIVGAGIGNVAIVPDWLDGANITQTTARISISNQHGHNKYYFSLFQSEIGRVSIELSIKGAAQPGLNLSAITEYIIVVPPINEQIQIVQNIEAYHRKCDIAITQAQREIDLLLEYRTALISEVVTGKLDVREKIQYKEVGEKLLCAAEKQAEYKKNRAENG
jgi:type I restriction enzyme S subunit